jgi:hypothetical protein
MKRKMRILALVSGLMVAAIMFIGCTVDAHVPAKTEQGQGQDQTSKKNLIAVPGEPNLAVKFGVIGTEPGAVTTEADVTKTLEKIHEHLEDYHDAEGIDLGDYIVLPSLEVEALAAGALSTPTAFILNNVQVLVVGKNSFSGKNENVTTTPHLVFQFKDALVKRKMISAASPYSYATSGMKEYLRVNFVTALREAGVSTDYLWPVKRAIAEENDFGDIDIKIYTVWLPTEWEIFGDRVGDRYSPVAEASSNQVWLEYYNTGTPEIDKTRRTKTLSDKSVAAWWLASSSAADDDTGRFACAVSDRGGVYRAYAISNAAADSLGFSPAFCIK